MDGELPRRDDLGLVLDELDHQKGKPFEPRRAAHGS